MKTKAEREKFMKAGGVFPAERNSKGEPRLYRDSKIAKDFLYYEDSTRNLVIRQVLMCDASEIVKFKNNCIPEFLVMNKKKRDIRLIKPKTTVKEVKEEILASTNEELMLSLMIFKRSSAVLQGIVDIEIESGEMENANMLFLFPKGIAPKSQAVIKKILAEFVKKERIAKEVFEAIPTDIQEKNFFLRKIS